MSQTSNTPLNQIQIQGQSQDAIDFAFMRHAIQLAKKAQYTARPNPLVACLVVCNNQIISEGFHLNPGNKHAEIEAMDVLKTLKHIPTSASLELYITLEPCHHQGRTPPCTTRIQSLPFKRIIIGTLDPNPQVSGKGLQYLKSQGYSITCPVLPKECQALNAGYFYAHQHKIPYIRLKTASSLDGATAMQSGESQWITSSESREDAQYLRAQSDAIITGIGTVLADNPRLTVRNELTHTYPEIPAIPAIFKQPDIILFDRQLRIPNDAHLLQDTLNKTLNRKLIIVTNEHQMKTERAQQLISQGVHLINNHSNHPDPLSTSHILQTLLQTLYQMNYLNILLEAGNNLSTTFLEHSHIQEIHAYIAPCFLGKNTRPLTQLNFHTLKDQLKYKIKSHISLGSDIKLTLTLRQ